MKLGLFFYREGNEDNEGGGLSFTVKGMKLMKVGALFYREENEVNEGGAFYREENKGIEGEWDGYCKREN